jgi:murein DD-endopeptidase MepM/ murein hydrolase activator NlpD
MGTGVAAFGVASSTTLDNQPAPTRWISESIALPTLQEQATALEAFDVELHRNDLTRSSDTADSLLQRLGVNDTEAARFLRQDPIAQRILMGRPGKQVQVRSVASPGGGQLAELIVRGPASESDDAANQFTRITVKRGDKGLTAQRELLPLRREVKLGAGTIESSLFAAADEARLPDAVTMQMAELFGADIDFRRELRKGDTFALVYETLTADGEPVTWNSGSGRVLSARFVNAGRTHEAIWFQDGDKGGYFSPDGQSKARMFLSSPLAFSRVTSGFAMRFHPIHQIWKAHLGVDYAAPIGTPVRAVGDGSVDFAGVQNGYGNVVVLRHAGGRSTVYAHLSRIGVRRGEHVAQGANIGAVGATGWATGPHLHFEFKVGAQHVDPIKIARASEAVQLNPAAKPRFDAVANSAKTQLASAARPAVAFARME